MGHTTNKRHLRSIATPKTWSIPRKIRYWIIKPSPGPHSIELSMPILVWLRDYLRLVKTSREARFLLNSGKIIVDGKKIKDPAFPVGLMDVLHIKDIDKYYRVLINTRHQLYLKEISKEEANIKLLRVKRKQTVKGGRIQVTTHDGRNFIVDNNIKTGDTIVYDINNKKIIDVLPLEKDVIVYFFYGAKVGTLGKVQDIIIRKRSFGHTRFIRYIDLESGEEKETIWDYSFVVGKDKPLISIN